MSSPPRTHAPHVFVDDLRSLAASEDDMHHLEVLRIRDGAEVVVSDGMGSWRLARKRSGGLDPAGSIEVLSVPSPPIAVAFGLTKGDKPETVVQKLTELGVDRIVPVACERSVVRWDEAKAHKNHARLVRVAREAAMQSRRVTLPIVEPVCRFADLVAGGRWSLAHHDGVPLDWPRHTSVLVGPEGGFSEGELASVVDHLRLGPHNLRAETAAVVAGALLCARRVGDA